MMAMQMHGGVGYDDLNQLLKEPQDLEFIFEVLTIEEPEDYEKETWQLNPEEKNDKVPELKEEGNRLYREGHHGPAAERYAQALAILEQLMLREKPHDEEWLELQKVKLPLLLNFAQCKLLEGEFYAVIEHCSEVLEVEPDNVKALYRRGRAHAGAWNPERAKKDLWRAAELDPALAAACAKEIRRVEADEKRRDEEDKRKLQHLF